MSTQYAIAQAHLARAGDALRRSIEDDPHFVDKLTALDREVLALGHGKGPIHRAENRADQIDRQLREMEREVRPDELIERRSFSMEEYVARPSDAREDDKGIGVLHTLPEEVDADAL